MSLRVWTRLMGFLTGMILAMVGAAFALGKLTSPESEIAGGASGAMLSIKSASPGVVPAVLGTVLIGHALVMSVIADVDDGAVYFRRADQIVPLDPSPVEALNPAKDRDAPPRPSNGAAQ